MTDTSKFRPEVSKLFEPDFPLPFGEQIDTPLQKRRTHFINGIGQYLQQFDIYKNEEFPQQEITEEEQSLLNRINDRKNREVANKQKLDEDFSKWDALQDPNIKGDPYKTLFIARLDHELTEIDLQKEFSKFGDIERVRVVRDKTTNKSKGYGFILFEKDSSARAAYKEGNGITLNGRKILTDIERGRTIKSWIPRRLGGGLGGRGYTKEPKPHSISSSFQRTGANTSSLGGSRGGRGGHREGYLRFGSSRGGRGGNSYDSRSRYESGGRGYNGDRYGGRRDNSYRDRDTAYEPRPRYIQRSDRPESSRDASNKTENVIGYTSRSSRQTDFNDRDRDQNRDTRVQTDRERERERYREQRIENQKERQRY